MKWQTTPPPIAVELELETTDGKALTGQVSFLARHELSDRTVTLYILRPEGKPIFEVKRWRRVEG